jgi:hypothetical protein
MAKLDKHAKQQQRARAELDSALARGNAAGALDAWLSLPSAQRDERREPLTRVLRTALAPLVDRQDTQAALSFFQRLSRDQSLLEAVANEPRMRWLLFTAALRARQWSLARSGWLWFSPRPAPARGPLAAAIDTTLDSEGRTASSEIAPLMAADAERLGRPIVRSKAGYPLPENAQDAEQRCLACFAREPFARFCEQLKIWLERATPSVAQTLRPLAAQLAQRELLSRFDEPARALEPARFCASLALAGQATQRSDALQGAVGLALRVTARVIENAHGTLSREQQTGCCLVLQAACADPELSAFVSPLLIAAAFDRSDPRVLGLARAALEREPSAQLSLFAASVIHDRLADEQSVCRHEPAPAWLINAVERALERPESFGAALDAAGNDARMLAHALLGGLPLELAVRVVDEAWLPASEDARQVLAETAEELVERMHEARSEPRAGAGMDVKVLREMAASLGMPDLSKSELRGLLASPDVAKMSALLGRDADGDALPVAMQPLWRKLEAHVVPYAASHLDTALCLAGEPAAKRALVQTFWSTRTTLVSRLRALADAGGQGLEAAESALEAQLFDQLECQALDAAQALYLAEQLGAPVGLQKRMHLALLEALERDPTARDDAYVAAVLRRCERRWASKKRRAKRKPKSTPKAKAAPKREPTRARADGQTTAQPAAYQTELALSIDASIED